MPDTPLNPDALEAAARALLAVQQPDVSADYAWNAQFDDGREELRKEAAATVSAYLAAALPEVTSVEELDQLPDRSVVLDADGAACQRNGFGMDGNCWDSMGEEMLSRHIPLPARVLYRPAVKP